MSLFKIKINVEGQQQQQAVDKKRWKAWRCESSQYKFLHKFATDF